MADHILRGLVEQAGLRVICARATETARISTMLHGCYPSAAVLLGEALSAGVLVGALQKDGRRVNLQVECDGPVQGLLVDADSEGNVRATIRRPEVNYPGDPLEGARKALGSAGYLSVLKEQEDGSFYRGSVALGRHDLKAAVLDYFDTSEQVRTALDLVVVPRKGQALGEVAGILVQKLPDGDDAAVKAARERIAGGAFHEAVARGAPAQEAVRAVVGGAFELLADMEIAYRCTCSKERAYNATSALGAEGVEEVLREEKQAVVTCEFCRQRYVLDEAELKGLLGKLRAVEK